MSQPCGFAKGFVELKNGQILDYLDYFGLSEGYMVSFNFNQKKEPGVKRLTIGDRILFEATV